MLRTPVAAPSVKTNPAFQPIIRLCDAMLYTPGEIAEHWRISEGHLSNLRRAGKGPSFIKLATGAVRYPLAEIVAYEIAGRGGPITLDRIETALSVLPGLSATDRDRIVAHLKAAFGAGA